MLFLAALFFFFFKWMKESGATNFNGALFFTSQYFMGLQKAWCAGLFVLSIQSTALGDFGTSRGKRSLVAAWAMVSAGDWLLAVTVCGGSKHSHRPLIDCSHFISLELSENHRPQSPGSHLLLETIPLSLPLSLPFFLYPPLSHSLLHLFLPLLPPPCEKHTSNFQLADSFAVFVIPYPACPWLAWPNTICIDLAQHTTPDGGISVGLRGFLGTTERLMCRVSGGASQHPFITLNLLGTTTQKYECGVLTY